MANFGRGAVIKDKTRKTIAGKYKEWVNKEITIRELTAANHAKRLDDEKN